MNEIREKAFALIDQRKEEMLAFWEKLVNLESWAKDKANVDKTAEYLKNSINSFGGQARVHEFAAAGNAVVASFGTPSPKAPFCFLGHFDTVFPTGETTKRPFVIKDGNAYGPGALDMKGGVTIAVFAARALLEAGYTDRQIKIVFAGDEEIGHPNSEMGEVFLRECAGAVAAINFETGDIDGSLVVGRKGTAPFDMSVRGVSVHAGREPQNGRNAILELAHKIIDIQALSDYEAGITFNVGKIKGGTARNAVPDNAVIEIDVRVLRNDQLAYVEEKMNEIAAKTYIDGTTTSLVKDPGSLGPMERIPDNDRLFEYVKALAPASGNEISTAIVSGGGSDSAYSVMAGVPTIDQMGVQGKWNHSDREYAVVESLFRRAKLAIDCVLGIDAFEKRTG